MLIDNNNENNKNISNTSVSSKGNTSKENNSDNNSNKNQTTEMQKCIHSLKECIQYLEQIQKNNYSDNSELISNNEIISLKLHIDTFTDNIKKRFSK